MLKKGKTRKTISMLKKHERKKCMPKSMKKKRREKKRERKQKEKERNKIAHTFK